MLTYKVPINSVIPQLILAQPIYTQQASLLAKKDTILSWELIKKFKIYSIEFVIVYYSPNIEEIADNVIYDDGSIHPINESIPHKSLSKKSNIYFEHFKKDYYQEIGKVQNIFKTVVDGDNINTKEIIQISNNMLAHLKFKEDLFTYLNALQAKDKITYNHSLNVSLICNIFGHWLKMNDNEIEMLTTAGLLHDIGKLKIDNKLLNKVSPLTDLEFEKIKTHVLKSYKMVSKLDLDDEVKQAILLHHEKLDGSGYMIGAKGDDINQFARILTIADMYDALTKDKPYRQKFSPLNVLKYLKSLITELDYNLVNNLTLKIARSFEGKQALLNNDQKCMIIKISDNHVNRPIVKYNCDVVDLFDQRELFVRDIIG